MQVRRRHLCRLIQFLWPYPGWMPSVKSVREKRLHHSYELHHVFDLRGRVCLVEYDHLVFDVASVQKALDVSVRIGREKMRRSPADAIRDDPASEDFLSADDWPTPWWRGRSGGGEAAGVVPACEPPDEGMFLVGPEG